MVEQMASDESHCITAMDIDDDDGSTSTPMAPTKVLDPENQSMDVSDDYSTSTPTAPTKALYSTPCEELNDTWLHMPILKTSFQSSDSNRIENELIERYIEPQHHVYSKDIYSSFVPLPDSDLAVIPTLRPSRNAVLNSYLNGRALRCSIQKALLPMTRVTNMGDFLQVMRHAVLALHWLYTKAKTTHGNVNPNNVKGRYDPCGVQGVLVHRDVPGIIDHTIRAQLHTLIGRFAPEMISGLVGGLGREFTSKPLDEVMWD
ncbi:hypothetical protein FB446DRAFT_756027 [Lentinula raphanica]|nr:hypothetical protein FB446DRAFT_756027 [Lentinula raphanica]